MNKVIEKMETNYILTSFKIEKDYYQCQCGFVILWLDDYEKCHTATTHWEHCPACGKRRVEYITEEQALRLIAFWIADVDLDEYQTETGLDYPSLELDYSTNNRYNRVFYRSFDDFIKLIDKACKLTKKGWQNEIEN